MLPRARIPLLLAALLWSHHAHSYTFSTCEVWNGVPHLCPADAKEGVTAPLFNEAKTDKFYLHGYHRYYDLVMAPYFGKKVEMLEIGVMDGKSLEVWKSLFAPDSHIYGMAYVNDKTVNDYRQTGYLANQIRSTGKENLTWRGTRILYGDQSKCEDLHRVAASLDSPDIIIDDGSHVPEHQLRTFLTLFPKLKPGGLYIIEDTLTSYWDNGVKAEVYQYSLAGNGMNTASSIVTHFRLLAEAINMVFSVACSNIKSFEPLYGPDIDPHVSYVFIGKSFVAVRKTFEGESEFFYRNPENSRNTKQATCVTTGQKRQAFMKTMLVRNMMDKVKKLRCPAPPGGGAGAWGGGILWNK